MLTDPYKEFLAVNLDNLLHQYLASKLEMKLDFSEFCKDIYNEWVDRFHPELNTLNENIHHGLSRTQQ